MEDQVDEQVEERMANLLQLENVVLNRGACREIFQEGMRYTSDMMLGKWSDFLPGGDENTQLKPEDVRHAVLKMARWAVFKGYRMGDEVFKDKAKVHSIIQSHYATGYIRGQESMTTKAQTLNMEPWFLNGIQLAGQVRDITMPAHQMTDKEAPEGWVDFSLSPWGDRGTYKPSAPNKLGFYPDDPSYTASQMHRDGISDKNFVIRHFGLPKVIRLPFLGWSPISPSTYQSWSAKTLLQDTSTYRRLMYERKDLDISRLQELTALRKRWQTQDANYLERYKRYVVSDPVARERGSMGEIDVSYLPAQKPPVVEMEEKPLATLEPCYGVLDTVIEDAESDSGGSVGESERDYEQHGGTDFAGLQPRILPVITDSPTSFTTAPFEELTRDENRPTSPIIMQIDELISNLMEPTPPPPATEGKNEAKSKKSKLPSLLKSHLGSRISTKSSEYHPSVDPSTLVAHAKSEEKPLPPWPLSWDRDRGSPSQLVEGEGHGQEESENGKLLQTPPFEPATPSSTMRESLYVLRNSLPHQHSSREALEAYARAVEDVHVLQWIGSPLGNDGSDYDDDSKEDGGKKGSRENVSTTEIPRGLPSKVRSFDTKGEIGVLRSAITHDADGSVYSEDEGEKEVVERTRAAEVGVTDSQEPLQRRWTSLRRVGSSTSKLKNARSGFSGIRGFFGVGI
jgi:hypothetical protein